MAINKDSNGFTFGFAIVMVVLVGTVLAVAAISLKPYQDENKRQEKMKDIMRSAGAMTEDDDMANAPLLFEQYVKEQIVLNSLGEPIESDVEAFKIDTRKEYKEVKARARAAEERSYPLFICEIEAEKFYVVPVNGTGLWGPIWGYVAFKSDMNTIYGAIFDHQAETPGLGAEISQAFFQTPFEGMTIFDENYEFVSIRVLKGGGGNGNPHAVDGITGGTITSVGVDKMLMKTLKVYVPYFKMKKV